MCDTKEKTENQMSPTVDSVPMATKMGADSSQSVIVRVKGKDDYSDLIQLVEKLGGKVVSEGRGVLLIEAKTSVLDEISLHDDVLSIDSRQKLEMRVPHATPKKID